MVWKVRPLLLWNNRLLQPEHVRNTWASHLPRCSSSDDLLMGRCFRSSVLRIELYLRMSQLTASTVSFFFLFLNLLHALSFLSSPSVRRQTVRWSLSLQSLETSPNYLVLNIGLSHLSTSPFIVLSQCPPPVQYLYLSFHFLWTCSRHWLSLLQPLIAELHLWCSGVCLSSVSLEPQLILNWPNEWVSSQACGW